MIAAELPPTVIAQYAQPASDAAELASRVDIDINSIALQVAKSGKDEVDLRGSVLDVRVKESMSTSPTVTIVVHDPAMSLMSSDVLFEEDDDGDRELRAIDVEIEPGRWYRLAKLGFGPASEGAGLDVTLTFEHRVVAYLKSHSQPRKVSRARMTRAEFLRSLAREIKAVNIRFYSPELHKTQPLAKPSKDDDVDRSAGLGDSATIKVKGRRATSTQRRNLADALTEGERLHASKKVLRVAVMVITQESDAQTTAANGNHLGLYQQDPNWGSTADRKNATKSSRAFFKSAIAIDKAHPHLGLAELAEKVQASGQGSLYDKWRDEAGRTVRAFSGTGKESRSYNNQYNFQRGVNNKRETTWKCSQRLAAEVNWRSFVTGKSTWVFASEPTLFNARARMRIDAASGAVISHPAGDIDRGKSTKTLNLSVRVVMWSAPAGSVVIVEGYGAADGRWLVDEIERSYFSDTADVTLKKPAKPKPEPRSEKVVAEQSEDAKKYSSELYSQCFKISDTGCPYVWGGGHAGKLSDVVAKKGLDCSGSVSLGLYKASLFGDRETALVAADFKSWGAPGKGRTFTVWYNTQHVWIEFINPKSTSTEITFVTKMSRFDTSPQNGETQRGPRMRKGKRSTDGFSPRHYPGL